MNTENTQATVEQQNDTLFGGRILAVQIDETPSRFEEIKIVQLKLAQYEAAFMKFDSEFDLIAIMCGKDVKWVQSLTPESYEALYAAAQEVNARGFFVYADRRQATLIKKLNSITPEILKAAANGAATSSSSPQRFRPRAA